MSTYLSESSRLHGLLTELMQQSQSQRLRSAWSEVLRIPESDVPFGSFGLPRVAALVSGAERDAARAYEHVGLPVRHDMVVEWSKPVNVPGGNLDSPLHQQMVSGESLAYLLSVASVLQRKEGHTALPERDELAGLIAQVSELAQSIEAADDLPDDVKQALLHRITELRSAIEHVRIGGAESIQKAVELLLGATVVHYRRMPHATAEKVWRYGLAVLAVFVAGPPQVEASIEAVSKLLDRGQTLVSSDDQHQGLRAAPPPEPSEHVEP